MPANWRTSAAALTAAAAGFVALHPELFVRWPWAVPLAQYVAIGGFAGVGLLAHDSGGQK